MSRRGSSNGLSLLLQSLRGLCRLRLSLGLRLNLRSSRLLSRGCRGIIIEADVDNKATAILLSRLSGRSSGRSSWLSTDRHRGQLSSAELVLEGCGSRVENGVGF